MESVIPFCLREKHIKNMDAWSVKQKNMHTISD